MPEFLHPYFFEIWYINSGGVSYMTYWKTIKELGEPDSIILIQQFFYEKTAKEIGKMLSMTAAAVHKRSTRARERLKKQMHENGIAY